jgi:hypothetical protein
MEYHAFCVRTDRHMTITEAHPYHGMSQEGREALDRGGCARVWVEYDERCPLCRAERSDSLVGRFRAIREANAPPPDGRKNPYELMLELRED